MRPLTVPSARISHRAADRLRAGHLWVYRSDIEELSAEDLTGALVTLVDPRGTPLGTALHSTASEIALRLVSREPDLTRAQYLADLRTRIEAAIHLRATALAPEAFTSDENAGAPGLSPFSTSLLGTREFETNACRLIFSEADSLPGIVADRYNGLVILQLLTQGTARDDVRRILAEAISAHSWCSMIVERPDPRIRELEQLSPAPVAPIFSRASKLSKIEKSVILSEARSSDRAQSKDLQLSSDEDRSLATVFSLNGLRFHYNANSGQKTGAFLDQRLNYAAAARIAHGKALDICTYQGGFALHLARTCTHVTGVDASRAAAA